MNRAARSASPAVPACIVLVVATAGEKTPALRVYAASALETAKLDAAHVVETDRTRRAAYEVCRAAGAQLAALPAVRVQLKALSGDRAASVLAADARLERAQDDEANRHEVAGARAALLAAYLAA